MPKLRRCLNDLVSVLALPAMWTDKDPQHIASMLADALLGMLKLAFVLVCLNDPDGRPSLEILRVAEPVNETR